MNHNQRDLILKLSMGTISKSEFLHLFPVNPQLDEGYICKSLNTALLDKNADDVEHIMLLGFNFTFPSNCADVLCRLMLEDWHNQHENIALILKDLRFPETVDCLFRAATAEYAYLEYDESFSLGVKCVYALHAIGTTEARHKLQLLCNSGNEIIAQTAKRLFAAERG